MKTKDRILDVATQLFNAQGTNAVSTNHIAEAAGLSPGNLYYHYRNKDEIIRAIFERQFHALDVAFVLPKDRIPTLADIMEYVRINFRIMSAFTFIYRELVGLLRQDEVLRKRYVEVRARGYEGFHEIISLTAQLGLLIAPIDEQTVTQLADICWMISEFWLASLDMSEQPIDETSIQRGIDLMLLVLKPYFKPE
jgi:AcrR family transcriptional regulator